MTIHKWFVALAMFCTLGVAGCGGDDDDDDGGGSCAAAGRAICDAACACRDGDGCAVAAEGGGAVISFDSPEDCEGLYVTLGCSGGGDATIDWEACIAAVEVAECIGEGEETAVESPAACDAEE